MNTVWLSPSSVSRSIAGAFDHYVTCSRPQALRPSHNVFGSHPLPLQRNRMSTLPNPPSRRRRAAIALGSNLGNRIQNIEAALALLRENGINVVKTSSLYETRPMYNEDQGLFLNGACEVSTVHDPLTLLDTLQRIEVDLGRKRTLDVGEIPIEKGPRTIDLDILLYGAEAFDHDRLTIPHPLLHERDFVLRPLNDILPDVGVPTTGARHSHALSVSKLYSLLCSRDHSISPVTELAPNLPVIRSTDPARPTRIMAILNLTPDSFSDGGAHDLSDLNAIRSTVEKFVEAGATIIDVGGQSTRPGAQNVSPSEELERIIPVIRMIRDIPEGQSVAISVDTFVAEVARVALAAGADIINDVSGGQLSNGEILSVVAEASKTIILMHMRGDPKTMNSQAKYPNGVLSHVADELCERVEAAVKAGIPRWRIIVDPGIGFAKHLHHNLILLRDLDKVRTGPVLTGLPLLLGTSRKKFVGRITGVDEASSRVMGTAATVAASVAGGADIVRVHDVAEMAEVVKMSDAIYRRSHGPVRDMPS